MEWLVPWHASAEASRGVAELRRELPRTHQLWGIPVHAVAYRQDCDDILFALDDGTDRVAVVHLSFAVEHDPRWPKTELFESIQHFAATRMRLDHEDFVA
jgi:hypothetical protein